MHASSFFTSSLASGLRGRRTCRQRWPAQRRTATLVVLAIAAAFPLGAGCGGGSSPRQPPRVQGGPCDPFAVTEEWADRGCHAELIRRAGWLAFESTEAYFEWRDAPSCLA